VSGYSEHHKVHLKEYGRLKEGLSEINREGVAIDREEFDLKVKYVAAPAKDGNGNVLAAISVSEPSARLNPRRIQAIKLLIKDCGSEISRAIGYRIN